MLGQTADTEDIGYIKMIIHITILSIATNVFIYHSVNVTIFIKWSCSNWEGVVMSRASTSSACYACVAGDNEEDETSWMWSPRTICQ